MGLFDAFKKPKKTCDCQGWDKLNPDEMARAEQHYSDRLADAVEKVVGPTLESEDARYGELLRHSGLMRRVQGFPMPASAVAIPKKNGQGRVLFGYTWDKIEALDDEQLAGDLLQQIREKIRAGEIG